MRNGTGSPKDKESHFSSPPLFLSTDPAESNLLEKGTENKRETGKESANKLLLVKRILY